ncbi:hypothetical protein [Amycolatopsis thermophila]|uniref:PPE family protein n=1 Tax=Amycolatopsis thermophila TaxID=206084 RepID=A0ABU0ELK2_9PSEU|nr:hypothetical protein [Amycolatopsis thermophila]MDQ0376151.1 hypothetical protein [Amycolatopsis thermophila]
MAGDDDPTFGYDLKPVGAGAAGAYYTDDKLEHRDYDFKNLSIEDLHRQIVQGEQPGTTADRAQQWLNVALMLQTAADDLHDQTQTLADHWKSPAAKKVFLAKVGMTLAHLRQWQDAALNNGTALYGLSNVMYEAQAEMDHLYQEYKTTKADAVKNATRDLPAAVEWKSGPLPGTDKDKAKAAMKVESEYDQKAQKLAEKIAGEYAPYIAKMQAAHAPKLEVLNAIWHPEANGTPRPPTLPPPGAPGGPGGAPPGPGGAPPPPGNAPKPPPTNAPGPPPPGDAPKPPPKNAPGPPPGAPPPAPGTPPPAPAPSPGPAPTAPNGFAGSPPPGNAPNLPPALAGLAAAGPALAPNGFTGKPPAPPGFGGTGPNLFSGNKVPTGVPPTLGLGAGSPTPPPAGFSGAPPSVNQNSLYPPGTITPPPGSQLPQQPPGKELGGNRPGAPTFGTSLPFDDHLDLEAKAAYQQYAQSAPPPPPGGQSAPPLPPGAQSPVGGGVRQPGSRPGAPLMGDLAEQSPAFQPPPSTTPPVLDNDRKRTARGGSTQEAPTGTRDGLPPGVGAPPVLSNPHRKAPAKTFSEWQAERRRRRPQPGGTPQSEFTANLPASTTSVFDGRISAEEYLVGSAGEIPSVLRAPTPVVSAPDRHAKPVVHADRATRVAKPDEKAPVTDQSVFEVETPGGPVVANGEPEKRYRPAEPSALNGRN